MNEQKRPIHVRMVFYIWTAMQIRSFVFSFHLFLQADKRIGERTCERITFVSCYYIPSTCAIGAAKSGRLVCYHNNAEPFVTYSTIYLKTRRFYSLQLQRKKKTVAFITIQFTAFVNFVFSLNSFCVFFLVLSIFVFSADGSYGNQYTFSFFSAVPFQLIVHNMQYMFEMKDHKHILVAQVSFVSVLPNAVCLV